MASTSSAKQQASSAAKRARDEVADGAEEVGARVKATGRRVKEQAEEIEDTLARGASDIADTVSERLRSVGVDTDRMVDAAKDQATELQQLIMDEVRDRPLRALGIAAAIGLFVGFLSAR